MPKLRTIRWGVLLLGVSVCAAGQNASQSQGTAPAPAFGQNSPILNPDNPPLSGLDEPKLELRTQSRSFISTALQVGESADSNGSNQLGGSTPQAVSHVMGAFDLQKFWPRSDLFLEYLGGGAFGNNPYYARQLQAAGMEGVTRWRTGQATLRDAFSYLPDGSFYAASAGGLPGFGIATGGLGIGSGLLGLIHFGSGVGTIPRISNTGVLDVVQAINPKSAFTLVGAFSNAHYFHNTDNLVNGDQTTIEGGYSRLLNRHDQVAAVYAFQLFRFPDNAGGQIFNHVFNVRWSHTISGRLSFVGGVGPQYSDVQFGGSFPHWSVAGRASLRYRYKRASLSLGYEKFNTQGSGLFAGSKTQRAQFSVRRPLGRTFDVSADAGYSHNTRLQSFIIAGVNASSYDEGFGGVTLRKHLGRTFDAIAAYHFSEAAFGNTVTLNGATGKSARRQVGTIAVEWHPRAIRIE